MLACLTNTADGAKRQEGDEEGKRRGYMCDPGGYTRIARKTGMCRKTVYNAIHALIDKGVLEVWKVQMKGQQRVKTLYFALHYGDILPAWRADKRFFHTAHKSSIVVRKRSKRIVTVDEGKVWHMDPAHAPKRGCGRGLTEIEELRVAPAPEGVATIPAPAAISDEDLSAVHMELLRQTGNSCLQDAIDVITDARTEAKRMGYAELGYGGAFPALTVLELIREAAAEYRPSRHYPMPTVGWFMGGSVRRRVAHLLKHEWEQKQA